MKKILFLIHALNSGGAQRALVDMVNHINLEKFDITILTIYDRNGLQSQLNPKIHYKSIIKTKNKYLKTFLAYLFRRILSLKWIYVHFVKGDYDYEVAYLEGEATRLLSYSTNEKSKKYAWVHTNMMTNFSSQGLYNNLNEHIETYKKFDKIICVSQSAKDAFVERFGFDENVIVKYNICDEEKIIKNADEQIHDFNKSDCITFITVSNLRPEKRHCLLLKILKKLKDEGYDFVLNIVGDGPEKSNIINLCEKLNLNNVFLLGNKSNPYSYMKNSDLMIISSEMEGYSSVAVEASLLELPTLTTDCGGPREIFNNGELGIIVDNNEEGLYNGMKKVLSSPCILNKYRRLLKENKNKFSACDKIKDIEKLFED